MIMISLHCLFWGLAFRHRVYVTAAPDTAEVRRVMTAFNEAFDVIAGKSEQGFTLWPLKDTFFNAYGYVIIRMGLRHEGLVMPSDRQHLLSCQWISCFRLIVRLLMIELDENVSLFEARGRQLMGELGFVFRSVARGGAPEEMKKLSFTMTMPPLELCGFPNIPTDLPALQDDMKNSLRPKPEIVDLGSDEEVYFLLSCALF
jgi:hypothetical protein